MSEQDAAALAEVLTSADISPMALYDIHRAWGEQAVAAVLAATILASPWLAAHDARVRSEERERLAAVEALHRRIGYADTGDAYCAHDNQWWPCATATAVRAAVAADPADTGR